MVIGIAFLIIALMVLYNGNYKLSTLSACTTFEICPGSVSPSGSHIQSLMIDAKGEIVYGMVFALVACTILFFGLQGSGVVNRGDEIEEREEGERERAESSRTISS